MQRSLPDTRRSSGPPSRSLDLLQHPERLRTLRDAALLDGAAEDAFDRLARMAARAVRAPVALLGFVDADRFFLKSQLGLAEPWAGWRQPPLPGSLARHVVLSGQPLAVEDLRHHPLMRDDVAAATAGLVAYLGVPVFAADGLALGCLCVLDGAPRRWSEEDVLGLRDVAGCVAAEIELRLRADAPPALAQPFEESPVPMLMLAADTHEVLRVNPAAAQRYGLSGEGLPPFASKRETERIRDEIISVMSHELRTPLTAMRGSLGLLAAGRFGELDPQVRRMLDIAVSNAERLSRLVHDILDLEQIAQGGIRLDRRPVGAEELMECAAAAVRPAAERSDVLLHVSPLAVQLRVDPDRVCQILVHLLENAVKFSAAGGAVWLAAEQRGDAVVFSVRDQGRGVPAHQRSAVFERFRQGDSSDSRRKGGTGLGLALCRGLVEAHGGHIWVEGGVGQGADFRFALPRELPAE